MYTPVSFDSFPGLRLLPEQAQAPGSVTMLNADIAKDLTQVGSRAGLTLLGTGTASYQKLAPRDLTHLVVARNTGSGIVYQEVAVSGGAVGSATTAYGGASTAVTSMIPFGVSTNQSLTLAATRTGSSNENVRLYGASAVDMGFAPRYVAVTPVDNRLVAAHYTATGTTPSGANGSTSTVFFSQAGVLTAGTSSFNSTDWVQLAPGDTGEEIAGVAVWRELTFVVKRSKLFIFYGDSTDDTGNAVFNYRTVDLPSRTRVTANRGGSCMVAGNEGVYLLGANGVYRTTGDVPTLISREITPIFDGTGDSSMLFPSSGDWTFGYSGGRLFLSYQVSSTYRTLVYDPVLDEWLLWDVSAGQSALPTNVVEWVDANGVPVTYVSSGAKVYLLSGTGTSDDGTAITSSYQSGFSPLVGGAIQKTVRQTHLWGYGSPTLSWFTDYGSTDAQAAAVTLGTSPAIAEGYDRQPRRGKLFSFKLNATSAWAVTKLQADVTGVRDAAEK